MNSIMFQLSMSIMFSHSQGNVGGLMVSGGVIGVHTFCIDKMLCDMQLVHIQGLDEEESVDGKMSNYV